MNQYQYDNIGDKTQREKQAVLQRGPGSGINQKMSKVRRAKKHARHAANELKRKGA